MEVVKDLVGDNPGLLDELFTLLKNGESHKVATAAGRVLIDEKICQVIKLSLGDFSRAWLIFVQVSDKGWSFTDYTSKSIMERLGITKPFHLMITSNNLDLLSGFLEINLQIWFTECFLFAIFVSR